MNNWTADDFIDAARFDPVGVGRRFHELTRIADALRQRAAELEAVLAFYADPDMHLRRGLDGRYPTLVTVDGGAAARVAIPNWEDIETRVDTAALLEA